MKAREEFLKECSGFGKDEEGNTLIDMSTGECQACRDEDREMWQACMAECGLDALDVLDADETGESEEPDNDAEDTEEGDGEMVKKKKTGKKQAKSEAKVKKGNSCTIPEALVKVLRASSGGLTAAESCVAVCKLRSTPRKTLNLAGLLSFGVALGVVTKEAGKYQLI